MKKRLLSLALCLALCLGLLPVGVLAAYEGTGDPEAASVISVNGTTTNYATLPAALTYLLTLLIGFGATLGLSEIIRRIPGIRYLTLGIRKEKKA